MNLGSEILSEVFQVIEDRRKHPTTDSYVSGLMKAGLNQILDKISEESEELIVAAREEKRENVIHEAADLLFHTMILLAKRGVSIEDIYEELKRRRR